jgi:hypothetical protein
MQDKEETDGSGRPYCLCTGMFLIFHCTAGLIYLCRFVKRERVGVRIQRF